MKPANSMTPHHPINQCRVAVHPGRAGGKQSRGFTMIELLAVIVVIVMLVTVVVKVGGYVKQKSNIVRAKGEIAAMSVALERFKSDNGRYPTSSTVRALVDFSGAGTMSPVITNGILLYTQLTSPQQYGSFKPSQLMVSTNNLDVVFSGSTQSFRAFTCIIDPWGHPYNYYRTYPVQTDQVNQTTFDLWSSGPNGHNENGTGDDISNWQR